MAVDFQTSLIAQRVKEIRDKIDEVNERTSRIDDSVISMYGNIESIAADLDQLRAEFVEMVNDQHKSANLQRAITELIRVRQEIEQKYGNYTTIRQTMLGVLQATDVALVKKTTISKVSEELMLSTPQYWLAPCLVAIAAWISNDKELAERAIRESMKRDEEKTALAMALICRRNGRTQTGYEWLSIYFAKQSASNFTEESFTYIDAYVNGIFGPDERHTCQGYVSKWIDEVRGNKSDFESSQIKTWKDYCSRYKKDTDKRYPDLAEAVPEYGKIKDVVGRITGLEDIKADFRGIQEAFVDKESMRKAVDAELVRLIGNYDASEMDIRKEEEYLALVKYFEGDVDKAKEEMAAREARRLRHKLDFIEQMSSEITSGKETTPSKKKTAITFLSTFINEGANRYIADSRDAFPEEVTVKVDDWSRGSKDGTEYQQLAADYEHDMNIEREKAIAYAENTKPKVFMRTAIVFAAIFILMCVVALLSKTTNLYILAAVLAAISAGCFFSAKKAKKNIEMEVARINTTYDEKTRDGKNRIKRVLEQWREAKSIVAAYDGMKDAKVVA